MRHPRPYLRTLMVSAAVIAGLATTGAVAFASTQPSHTQPTQVHLSNAENPTERRNIIVVQTALQVVFNEHRVDQIDAFFTEDFIQHSPLVSPDQAGRDGLKRWLIFADVQGTIQADLPAYGIKGTGQNLKVSTAQVFRVVRGKIAEHWEVADTGPLLQLALASH